MAHLPIPEVADAGRYAEPRASYGRPSDPDVVHRERLSVVQAWTHVMAALLTASGPDEVFREADRVTLAVKLTGGWPPYRELLLARTPVVTEPTTRVVYARRLRALWALRTRRPGDAPEVRLRSEGAPRASISRAEARRNGLL
jgi:hypothetical protein